MDINKKKAIIVGSNGQDGILLGNLLDEFGYDVTGVAKHTIDITNSKDVRQLVADVQPDEIYFLAAYHHSSEDKIGAEDELYFHSMQINSVAPAYFLEAIKLLCPSCRFFYASSSLIFPSSGEGKLNEESLTVPIGAYALSKVAGMTTCRSYRIKDNIFASCGILFNHESHHRKANFVTKKISIAVAKIARTGFGDLSIGNLDAVVDWGYAPDYVNAMHKILQLDEPGEFILATGIEHSIREYLDIAFSHVKLDYRNYVKADTENVSRPAVKRIGDPSKLKQKTGWEPSISFKEMVCKLVDQELHRGGSE